MFDLKDENKCSLYIRVQLFYHHEKACLIISEVAIPLSSPPALYFQTVVVCAVPVYDPPEVANDTPSEPVPSLHDRVPEVPLDVESMLQDIASSDYTSLLLYDDVSDLAEEFNQSRGLAQNGGNLSSFSSYANSGYQSIRTRSSAFASSSHVHSTDQYGASGRSNMPPAPIRLSETRSFNENNSHPIHPSVSSSNSGVTNHDIIRSRTANEEPRNISLSSPLIDISENNVSTCPEIRSVYVVGDDAQTKQEIIENEIRNDGAHNTQCTFPRGVQSTNDEFMTDDQLFSSPHGDTEEPDITVAKLLEGAVGGELPSAENESLRICNLRERKSTKYDKRISCRLNDDRHGIVSTHTPNSDDEYPHYSRPPDSNEAEIDYIIQCMERRGYDRDKIFKAIQRCLDMTRYRRHQKLQLCDVEALLLEDDKL